MPDIRKILAGHFCLTAAALERKITTIVAVKAADAGLHMGAICE